MAKGRIKKIRKEQKDDSYETGKYDSDSLPRQLAEALSLESHVVSKYIASSVERNDYSISNLFISRTQNESKITENVEYSDDRKDSIKNKPWQEYFPQSPRTLEKELQETILEDERIQEQEHTLGGTFLTSVTAEYDSTLRKEDSNVSFTTEEDLDSLSSFSEDEAIGSSGLTLNLELIKQTDFDNDQEYNNKTGRKAYLEHCNNNKSSYPGVTPISSFVDGLEREHMSLSHRGIRPGDIEAITEAMKKNIFIRSLDLSNNLLGFKGAEAVSELLVHNKYMSTLDVSNNNIGNRGAQMLVLALNSNETLKSLSLAGNNLGDTFAKTMALVLRQKEDSGQGLRHLNLSHNRIGNRGGDALADFLETNESITSLNLSWNSLRGKGAASVVNAIINQQKLDLCATTLRFLELSWNGIDDCVAESIGELIKTARVLELLDLSHNRLGHNSAISIANSTPLNETIKCLKLGFNPLGRKGTVSLLDSLKHNKGLRTFSIENTIQDGNSDTNQVDELYEISQLAIIERGVYVQVSLEYPPKDRLTSTTFGALNLL